MSYITEANQPPGWYPESTGDSGGGITPTGTKYITIEENGTTTEDVTEYASAEITVDVQCATSMSDVTISGTLAQPLSAANYVTLIQQIKENKACAEIRFNFQGTGVRAYLLDSTTPVNLYANGAQLQSTLSASMAFTLAWGAQTGELILARALLEGDIIDLLSVAGQIACTVAIRTLDAAVYE